MIRDAFFADPTSSVSRKGTTTGNVAPTTSTKTAIAESRSFHSSVGRAGTEGSATIRLRIASISAGETRFAASFDNERATRAQPAWASVAARTECRSTSDFARSVTERTTYITASTRPQARLHPKA